MRRFVFVLVLLLAGSIAPSSCELNNRVLFVSPPNGALDVARFPVISVVFEDPVSQSEAEEWVRLFDRTGNEVPLEVQLSGGGSSSSIVIATPASAEDRLLPASDYMLEIHQGELDATRAVHTRFRTGGDKSVFCVGHDGQGWATTCNESYWRDYVQDTDLEACTWTAEDNSCTCSVDTDEPGELLGRKPSCVCSEEEDVLGGDLSDLAAVINTEPFPDANKTSGLTDPIRIVLDRDIGASNAALYRMVIEDVTDGDVPPVTVWSGTVGATGGPTYSSMSTAFEASPGTGVLEPDRRYRVVLELAGTSEPSIMVAGTQPHRFTFHFNTWTGPNGRLAEVLPKPKTDGVDFPTHLPRWPHLRFVFDGPVAKAVAEATMPPFLVRRPSNSSWISRYATWYDVDMHRLHLMVFEPLAEGERYDVFCSAEFAVDIGNPACGFTPIAHFLVQAPLPVGGTDDIREGSRVDLEPSNEIWLPVRPHVLNHPHGLKERYSRDSFGPLSFLGHVMLAPEEPPAVATITVDGDDPNCLDLEADFGVRAEADVFLYVAGAVCASHSECGPGYTCETCSSPGNAGCPEGQKRCRRSQVAFERALTAYCKELVDNGTPACSVNDAFRCAAGSPEYGTSPASQSRLRLGDVPSCPTGYEALTAGSGSSAYQYCVPTGRVAIEFAGGEHYFHVHAIHKTGKHWDPVAQQVVSEPPPVVFQPADIEAPVTLVGTVPLPASGLPIPAETCRAKPSTPGYRCIENRGVCDTSTFQCVPVQQNMMYQHQLPGDQTPDSCSSDADCFDGFRCDPTLHACVIDGNHPAFACTGGDPNHPELGGTCSAQWVQVDATHNIWRIWWPHHGLSAGSRRFNFAARIADASGGEFSRLPLIADVPNYTECDYALDSTACIQSACEAWNELWDDYEAQVAARVAELANHEAPVGYWAHGYQLTAACDGNPAAHDAFDLAGPQGLFVRLPAGKTPSDYRIEGTPQYTVSDFDGSGELAFRGLTFDGFSNGMLTEDVAELSIRGNQWLSPSGFSVANFDQTNDPADLRQAVFSDNYLEDAGSFDQRSSASVQYLTTNNVYWNVLGKLHSSIYGGPQPTPEVCDDSSASCVRPACRVDFDCRIPFLDPSTMEIVGDDPTLAGTLPTCEDIDPETHIGTCSHGIVGQALFVDNVMLDSGGPNNGPWYNMRFQRNFWENGNSAQELLDLDPASYVSILDNLVYNAGIRSNVFSIRRTIVGNESFLRGIAVENNRIFRSPTYTLVQHHRSKEARPGGEGTPTLLAYRGGDGDVLNARGYRAVGNVLLDRPGAREWGAGATAGISVRDPRDAIVERNTVVTDSITGFNFYGNPAHPTSAWAERNVAVAHDRDNFDNLCLSPSQVNDKDLRASVPDVSLCANLSERPSTAYLDPSIGCEHQYVDAAAARARLFHEPLPPTPMIDYELFHRSLVPDFIDEQELMRAYPSYDPALEDDVLAVRPGHAACDQLAGGSGCDDPDPDDDLYRGSGDNCPNDYNPSQADTDEDGIGDACDVS